MYYNQQHQLYQQQSYDYLPEGSMQPTHHQQYQMYNPGFMENSLNMSHNNYNMMHNSYAEYDDNMQYNKVDTQQEFNNAKSVKSHNPIEHDNGEVSPSNDVAPLNHKQIRDLMDTKQLKVHASTNSGSRQIQKYLRKCSTEEVEEVLSGILD
jgi:hypothetical protein